MVSHSLAFYIFTIMLFFVFLVASLGFLTVMFGSLKNWTYNNSTPILTVDAKVIGKRFKTFQDTQGFAEMIPSYNYATLYFVTFEVENEEKLEFSVTSVEYDNLVEGNDGKLSYQGTRFLEFVKAE